MPELPEVETVRRGLEPALTGATFTGVQLNRSNLRFPFPEDFSSRLSGQRIEHVGRRAKYLLFKLSGGETLLSHLGMTGNFRFSDPRTAEKHDHVVFEVTGTRLPGPRLPWPPPPARRHCWPASRTWASRKSGGWHRPCSAIV